VSPVLRLDAVVVEPVAERGEPALDELQEQVREILSFRPPPTAVLGARLAFDVRPAAPGAAASLERVLREELAFVLGAEAPPVLATVLRAPVFLGLALLIHAETEEEPDPVYLRQALSEGPNLVLRDAPVTPGDLPEEGPDAVFVSLLEEREPGRLRLWAVTDHLRRGCVTNAVELLARLAGGA
jgi:aspartate-semialdehyde dehydrogenase